MTDPTSPPVVLLHKDLGNSAYAGLFWDCSVPRIVERGGIIATGGASAYVAIPDTSAGEAPEKVRLAATAACYVRLGKPVEATVVENAAGTGYAPLDTITLAGGAFNDPMVLRVATTKVVSATVAAGGAAGADGAGVIVEGTTGNGTKFRASVTVTGGAIASVQAISLAGAYTANPAAIALEPVTPVTGGVGLVGARLAVVMGVDTATVIDPGDYTADPANPVAQGATSGAGVGATFNATMVTAAAAGDMMWPAGHVEIIDAKGFDHVAAIQVTGAGVLQVSPVENLAPIA